VKGAGLAAECVPSFLFKLMSAVQKGRVSGSRLAILMKTAEENLDRRVPIPVDRSCGGL
jgi:glycerol-3-phosphate dehydrogenase